MKKYKLLAAGLAAGALSVNAAHAGTYTFENDTSEYWDLAFQNPDFDPGETPGIPLSNIDTHIWVPNWDRASEVPVYRGLLWGDTLMGGSSHGIVYDWYFPYNHVHRMIVKNPCKMNPQEGNTSYTQGQLIGGICVRKDDPRVEFGPVITHIGLTPLFFQVAFRYQGANYQRNFFIKTVDVYNSSTEYIQIYGRDENGKWWYWRNLNGSASTANGTSYKRWTLTPATGQAKLTFFYAISQYAKNEFGPKYNTSGDITTPLHSPALRRVQVDL